LPELILSLKLIYNAPTTYVCVYITFEIDLACRLSLSAVSITRKANIPTSVRVRSAQDALIRISPHYEASSVVELRHLPATKGSVWKGAANLLQLREDA
jgi:hypothetical protein